jgi:hypothetical protein
VNIYAYMFVCASLPIETTLSRRVEKHTVLPA